ncbi:MAG TPA: hypothetical protein VH062_04780, partial [Polyangiaceae bacterium]|nr:hypothetical protein [Polyangiaceae bacterium]
MTITNSASGTNVEEIASGIFRISTPVPPTAMPGGFTFNQFLVVDEAPLLFHSLQGGPWPPAASPSANCSPRRFAGSLRSRA